MKIIIIFVICLALGLTSIAQEEERLPKALKDSDFYENGNYNPKKVELGKFLFFDKILSGNKNISCATCHHPMAGTGDGLSLSIGEGAQGLGVTRNTGEGKDKIHERVPRNAPHVFNLGAKQVHTMFADGRVTVDATQPSGFFSPAGNDLPIGLDNVLAVQAMFPVTSATEMAGQSGENLQIGYGNSLLIFPSITPKPSLPYMWEFIASKLRAIPEYVTLFKDAYPGDISITNDITYVHAANAIAAFEAFSWRFDNSPFDRYLRGDKEALNASQKMGMNLFYSKAKCSTCHSGVLQSDMDFHSIAMPQIGGGKGDSIYPGNIGNEDFGRERVTKNKSDRYKFRTPILRNVQLTAPYGHAGAYDTLEAVVKHHLNPRIGYDTYDTFQATLPSRPDLDAIDFKAYNNAEIGKNIKDSSDINKIEISSKEFDYIIDFLKALTDPKALDMRKDIPKKVPSSLAVLD